MKTAAEVVPHLNLVPQHVPGPDQQVVKLGPALRPAPFGVPQSEAPQPAENLSERVPSGVFQFLQDGGVHFIQQVLQGLAGVVAGFRVGFPVGLPAPGLPQRQDMPHETEGGDRPGCGLGQPAQRSPLPADVIEQRVNFSQAREVTQPLRFRPPIEDGLDAIALRSGARFKSRVPQVGIVLVEGLCHLLELLEGQPESQGQGKMGRQGRVGFQGGVQPLIPRLVEPEAGGYLVRGVETGRQARFQRPFVEQHAGEGMKGADGGLVQVGDSLPAASLACLVLRCLRFLLQLLADAVPQF